MEIARIENGKVVNIEVVDADWVKENQELFDNNYCVLLSEGEKVTTGVGWSAETGFEQPVVETSSELTDGQTPLDLYVDYVGPEFESLEEEIEAALANG